MVLGRGCVWSRNVRRTGDGMSAQYPLTQAVTKEIRKRLSDAGISQSEAARRSGISRATLSRRLTGRSPFFMDELFVIAHEVLGVELADMFRETEAAI